MTADQQAWTLGAAPDCEITLDQPTVSGRHCRLTRTDDGFLLEDLGSTNGTFVNGARVTAPLAVTSADDVKLGPSTPLPWEKIEPPASERRIIRIGRAPDNDLVLDFPNVSGNHARVIVENGRATIEDLGSTNGVAIGNPDNLVKSAPLSERATVYFGSTTLTGAELLHPEQRSRSAATVAAPLQQAAATTSGNVLTSPRSIAIGVAALVVLAVAVGAAAKFLKRQGTPAEPAGEMESTEEPPPIAEPAAVAAVAKDPLDAVYSVLVQNKGTDELFHVGTAWAIGPHQLVTSGVVARYLEKYKGRLTAVQVRCASQDKVLIVSQWMAHPEFKRGEEAIKAPAEHYAELRKKLDEMKGAKQPPGEEEVGKLTKELNEADWQLFLAGERMVFFDVGLLTVEEALPFRLELSDPSRKLPIQSPLTLYGVPYDPESMASYGPQQASKLNCHFKRFDRPPKQTSDELRRLTVSSPADHHAQVWRGGPVLDAEGRVLGVYVRPTPPADPNKPITGKSFDAVLVDQLGALPIDRPADIK